MKRPITVVLFMFCFCALGYAQTSDTLKEVSLTPVGGAMPDSLPRRYDWQKAAVLNRPFPVQSFILPAAMIAYGATALRSKTLQHLNGDVKEQVWEDNPHKP